MGHILETIVVTTAADGSAHLAPYGLIVEDDAYVIAPFRPSPAIANLTANPYAVASSPRDVRVIAGCVTGRRDWPTEPADAVPGRRLADAFAHLELAVTAVIDHPERPRFRCRLANEVVVAPFRGDNRARAAVIEAAILSTRLGMLPRQKIESELAYLTIAVDKTAGAEEREGWEWILARIRDHLDGGAAARSR